MLDKGRISCLNNWTPGTEEAAGYFGGGWLRQIIWQEKMKKDFPPYHHDGWLTDENSTQATHIINKRKKKWRNPCRMWIATMTAHRPGIVGTAHFMEHPSSASHFVFNSFFFTTCEFPMGWKFETQHFCGLPCNQQRVDGFIESINECSVFG